MRLLPNADDYWFRVGRTRVNTTVLVTAVVVISWLVHVVQPGLLEWEALTPWAVMAGEVWRLVTWPFANVIGFWGFLNLVFFFMAGNQLEDWIGHRRMALLLGGLFAVVTVAVMAVGQVLPAAVAGAAAIGLLVILLWVAENPRAPWFFGIPMWVLGVAWVVIDVLGLVMTRNWGMLIVHVVSYAAAAVLGRYVGLLRDYAWIPGRRRTAWEKKIKATAKAAPAKPSTREKDQQRLDELLDRINVLGYDNLSPVERRELIKLRDRLMGNAPKER